MTEDSQHPIQSETPPVRMAPPTSPGIPQRREHAWPTPLGIVLMVFGVGAILGALWSVAGAALMSGFLWPTPEDSGMVAAMAEMNWMQYPLAFASLALGATCLYAGLGIARRKPGSGRVARIWAVAKLALAFTASAVGAYIQRSMMTVAMEEQVTSGASMPPGGNFFYVGIAAATFLFSWVWLSALPVFVLLWLRRPVIAQEIARWSHRAPTKGG